MPFSSYFCCLQLLHFKRREYVLFHWQVRKECKFYMNGIICWQNWNFVEKLFFSFLDQIKNRSYSDWLQRTSIAHFELFSSYFLITCTSWETIVVEKYIGVQIKTLRTIYCKVSCRKCITLQDLARNFCNILVLNAFFSTREGISYSFMLRIIARNLLYYNDKSESNIRFG